MHICINYYYYFIKNTGQNEDRIVFRLFILNKINNSAHTANTDGCLNSYSFFVPRIIYDCSGDKDKPAQAESKLNLRMRT